METEYLANAQEDIHARYCFDLFLFMMKISKFDNIAELQCL